MQKRRRGVALNRPPTTAPVPTSSPLRRAHQHRAAILHGSQGRVPIQLSARSVANGTMGRAGAVGKVGRVHKAGRGVKPCEPAIALRLQPPQVHGRHQFTVQAGMVHHPLRGQAAQPALPPQRTNRVDRVDIPQPRSAHSVPLHPVAQMGRIVLAAVDAVQPHARPPEMAPPPVHRSGVLPL